MSFLDRLVAALSGGTAQEQTPVTLAPPLSQYPTKEDADFARRNAFSYGTPMEAYTEGNVARLLGGEVPARGAEQKKFLLGSAQGMNVADAAEAGTNSRSTNVDLQRLGNSDLRDKMKNYYMQGALAANRSPIGALGFDPSRTAVDTMMQNPTVGGVYSPKSDSMYAATNVPSAIVHESVHRGINILRKNPDLAETFQKLPDEEYLVRYIMAKQAGDPEGRGGDIDKRQHDFGIYAMEKSLASDTYQRSLQTLERAAQEAIATKRPRGPR